MRFQNNTGGKTAVSKTELEYLIWNHLWIKTDLTHFMQIITLLPVFKFYENLHTLRKCIDLLFWQTVGEIHTLCLQISCAIVVCSRRFKCTLKWIMCFLLLCYTHLASFINFFQSYYTRGDQKVTIKCYYIAFTFTCCNENSQIWTIILCELIKIKI